MRKLHGTDTRGIILPYVRTPSTFGDPKALQRCARFAQRTSGGARSDPWVTATNDNEPPKGVTEARHFVAGLAERESIYE